MLNLTTQQQDKLKNYPNLKRIVQSFIAHNGESEEQGCLAKFTYFFKLMCLNNNLDEDAVFGWNKETSEDFYSWGHNSRWIHTAQTYILSNFNQCVNVAIDLVEDYGDIDVDKE